MQPSSTGSELPAGHPGGGRASLDQLMPDVYDDLRALARRRLAAGASGDTLSTTGLVHEAYLKLAGRSQVSWTDKGHFVALAALAMRHVLVDHAKARSAFKRDGMRLQVTLDDELVPADDQPELLLQLHDALDRLTAVEPRLAQIVDCRFFGGFSEEEIAESLGVTTRTIQRDWVKARMLLRRAMLA